MVQTSLQKPLTISMHERDNVAIVANDGGLPAGTQFPSGLTLCEHVPQGHKVALVDLPRRQAGAALQRADRLRAEGHSRRQLGARAAAEDAVGALARRPADRDRQACAAAAARGLHLRGLPQPRRLGRHAQHPGHHADGAVRCRRGRLRGAAHQGRTAAEVPERRRRGRRSSTPTAAALPSTRPTRSCRSARCATSASIRTSAARSWWSAWAARSCSPSACCRRAPSRSSTSATSQMSATTRKRCSTSSACRTTSTSASCR